MGAQQSLRAIRRRQSAEHACAKREYVPGSGVWTACRATPNAPSNERLKARTDLRTSSVPRAAYGKAAAKAELSLTYERRRQATEERTAKREEARAVATERRLRGRLSLANPVWDRLKTLDPANAQAAKDMAAQGQVPDLID